MPSSARLEIHEMNVGQGDSVLIINRDLDAVKAAITRVKGATAANGLEPIDYVPYAVKNGVPLAGTVNKALLVDAGDDEYGDDVVGYLEAHGCLETTPNTIYLPKLSLLVSHLHDDHLAGLRSVFKQRVETQVKQGRRMVTKVAIVDRYRPAAVYQTTANRKSDPTTQRYELFTADVTNAYSAAQNRTARLFVDPAGFAKGTKNTTVIDLGTGVDGIPIQLYCIAAAQSVYNKARKRAVAIASVTKKPDQNDRSIVLVLQYGSFRYFLGGDIAGNGGPDGGNTGINAADTGTKRYFSTHADVESTLGPALEAFFPATTAWAANQPKYPVAGYCTAIKANHHGSSSSVDVYLLGTLRPCLALISSGIRSRFHSHPTQAVMNRTRADVTPRWTLRDGATQVNNSITQIYVTEVAQKVKGKAFTVDIGTARIVGDIVLRPVDESIQAVHAATQPGQARLQVQVYGTGAQTSISAADTKLRPTLAENTTGVYPIGPWLHADTH